MGIEDKLNQAKGALKEGAGKLTGDKKTEIEGAVEKVVAKAKDGIEDVKEGDEVCIVGHQGNEVVTVDQISRMTNTINNETLTSISSRVPRLKVRS